MYGIKFVSSNKSDMENFTQSIEYEIQNMYRKTMEANTGHEFVLIDIKPCSLGYQQGVWIVYNIVQVMDIQYAGDNSKL